MKRTLVSVLLFLVALSLWAGGGSEGAATVNLTHWDLHTDPTRLEVIDQLLAELPFDNITVEMDHITNEGLQYKTKIRTALLADEQPDVFFMFAGYFIKPFIDSGKIRALDDFIAQDKVFDRTQAGKGNFGQATFGGDIYGLPDSINIAPVWCNTRLFADAGVELPTTFDELLAAVKALKANGVTPITMAGAMIWPPILIYEQLAIQHGGQDVLDDVANEACDDPAFLEAARDMKRLVDAGAFPENYAGIDYAGGEGIFLRGEAAMYVMGDWAAGPLQKDNTFGVENIKPIPFPAVSGGRGAPTDLWGGSQVLYCMSADTEMPEETWKWLLYFTENYSKEIFRRGEAPSVWKNDVVIENPLIKAEMPIAASATSMTWGWDFAFPAEEASDYMDNLLRMMAGDMTPEEFAASLPGAK